MVKIALILSALVVFIFLSQRAVAEETTIGLYLLNLGKFDVSTGSYTADFYLHLKCETACSSDFEFVNGRAASLDKIEDASNDKFYRIQANLNSEVDLRKFPFDSQKIEIILEDKKNTIEKLVYLPLLEESGIDKSIAFTGWEIRGWKAGSGEHHYPVYNETYSQYKFSIDITRVAVNSFIKTFLPVIFILMVVLFSFLLDPDKLTTRIGVAGSSLVAAVMFHVSITNQIPAVGYLTFADKFMVLSYLVLLTSFVVNIAMLQLQELRRQGLVEKIHKKTEYSVFIIVPMLFAVLFWFFL